MSRSSGTFQPGDSSGWKTYRGYRAQQIREAVTRRAFRLKLRREIKVITGQEKPE